MKLHHTQHKIPFFDVWVHFLVVDDVYRARKAASSLMGPSELEPNEQVDGLCEGNENGECHVFLDIAFLTHGLIAHELSHLGDGIMKHFNAEDSEIKARLIEYCTDLLYKDLQRKKIKVMLTNPKSKAKLST